jgi:hypothetical protein
MEITTVKVVPKDRSKIEQYSVSIDPTTARAPIPPSVLDYAKRIIQGMREKTA